MASVLHLYSFLFMVVPLVVPVYILSRSTERSLLVLASLLALFLLLHSGYHLFKFLEMSFIADVVFLPGSILILDAFGLYYLLRSREKWR